MCSLQLIFIWHNPEIFSSHPSNVNWIFPHCVSCPSVQLTLVFLLCQEDAEKEVGSVVKVSEFSWERFEWQEEVAATDLVGVVQEVMELMMMMLVLQRRMKIQVQELFQEFWGSFVTAVVVEVETEVEMYPHDWWELFSHSTKKIFRQHWLRQWEIFLFEIFFLLTVLSERDQIN